MNKHQTTKVGAACLFVNEEGKILLMKRSDNCHVHPGDWGLVGGFIDYGENPVEAAIREAKEEIGVTIEVQRFCGNYYNSPHPNYKLVICLPHYCKIIHGTPHPAQPEECSDVKWFMPEEIRGMEMAYNHKEILEGEGLI